MRDREAAMKSIPDRERRTSTDIQNGVALPHGTTSAVNEPVACVGIPGEGVDFDPPRRVQTHPASRGSPRGRGPRDTDLRGLKGCNSPACPAAQERPGVPSERPPAWDGLNMVDFGLNLIGFSAHGWQFGKGAVCPAEASVERDSTLTRRVRGASRWERKVEPSAAARQIPRALGRPKSGWIAAAGLPYRAGRAAASKLTPTSSSERSQSRFAASPSAARRGSFAGAGSPRSSFNPSGP